MGFCIHLCRGGLFREVKLNDWDLNGLIREVDSLTVEVVSLGRSN